MLSKIVLFVLLLVYVSPYMEFEIIRNPHPTKKIEMLKSECQDPSKITEEAKYIQLCYEKDIAYTFEFKHKGKEVYLALDLTSPISWIKNDTCKELETNRKCTPMISNLNERIKGIVKQKINEVMDKLRSKLEKDDSKAVIEGSNEIVIGQVMQISNLSIVARNHDHLSKLLDIFLLGLYIIGEHDNITLKSTNFISAHQITPNLNKICDGAISLRFDDTSQKSFLDEAFNIMQATSKIISVYIGKDKKVITIGGISPVYTENGFSSIVRVKMEQDQKYGKLIRLQGLVMNNQDQLQKIQVDGFVILTLSASYIAFPQQTISFLFSQFFPSPLKCKVNNQSYIECLTNNKQDVSSLIKTSFEIDLDTSMIKFVMKELILRNQNGRIVFNIKQSHNNYTIIGEPFFLNYYVFFDYTKNEIGYAPRKLTLEEHIISAVTLVHFIIISLLLGVCFIITSEPCKRLYLKCFIALVTKTKDTVRRYQPVDQNEEKVPRLEDVEGI